MYTEYQTERLILRILTPNYYKDVLEFQMKNRDIFEQYEPTRPLDFYSCSYQINLLRCEYKMAQRLTTVRFYVFSRQDPYTIIGTVCLHNITRAAYECCEIGYKFDRDWQHHGYAREAVDKVISIAFYELRLHRVFARVSLDNAASIKLLDSLHFKEEGIEQASILIRGKWTDHMRYALLHPH